jgi:hypothetical protein
MKIIQTNFNLFRAYYNIDHKNSGTVFYKKIKNVLVLGVKQTPLPYTRKLKKYFAPRVTSRLK